MWSFLNHQQYMIGNMEGNKSRGGANKEMEKDRVTSSLMEELKRSNKFHSNKHSPQTDDINTPKGTKKGESTIDHFTLGLRDDSKPQGRVSRGDKITKKRQANRDSGNPSCSEKENPAIDKRASILSLLRNFRRRPSAGSHESDENHHGLDVPQNQNSIDVPSLKAKFIKEGSHVSDDEMDGESSVENTALSFSDGGCPDKDYIGPSMECKPPQNELVPRDKETLQCAKEVLNTPENPPTEDGKLEPDDDKLPVDDYGQQILTDPYEFVYGETIQTPSDFPLGLNRQALKILQNVYELVSTEPLKEGTSLDEMGEQLLQHIRRKLGELEETVTTCNKNAVEMTAKLGAERDSNKKLLEENKRLKEEISKLKLTIPEREAPNSQVRDPKSATVNKGTPLMDMTNTITHEIMLDNNNNNSHLHHNQQQKKKGGVPNNFQAPLNRGEQVETFFREQTLSFLFSLGTDLQGVLRDDILSFYNEKLKILSYAMSLVNMAPSPTEHQITVLRHQIVQFYSDVLRKYIIDGVLADLNMRMRACDFLTKQLANMRGEKRRQMSKIKDIGLEPIRSTPNDKIKNFLSGVK